jgi:3-hydroxyethyl bacteriochlorophyllide a dehydrogenase
VVWEIDKGRQSGSQGYEVLHPDDDPRRDYRTIYDASGAADVLNMLIGRITKGGEIVLAGFYADDVSFAFPPAFMKEARFRIAAEWTPDDLVATRELVEAGMLSLEGLITHTRPAAEAAQAYPTAFRDPDCLKMILEWKDHA